MPIPPVYQPPQSPQDTPTSPPTTLQSPTGVTQGTPDVKFPTLNIPDLDTACNNGPLKIAENSGDEGFEVSVDLDPDLINSFATPIMGVPTGNPNEAGSIPPVPTPPKQAISPGADHPTPEQPMKPVVPEPDTPQESNESPTAVNGFGNEMDRMESSFSSEVNKANLAGHYMFTDINTLKEYRKDFPFMITHVIDFMCICGMIGYHDDVQQYNALKAEMKEICDKAKQPLNINTLTLNTLYIFLDPQGDPFRAYLKDKGRNERCLDLVDTGKYMFAGYESLYQIPNELAAIPSLSVKLRLNGVRTKKIFTKNEVIEIGKKFFKTLHVYSVKPTSFDKYGTNIYVELFDSTSNIAINRKIMEYLEPNLTQQSPGNSSHFQFPPQTSTQTHQETLYTKDILFHEPQLDVSAINALNIISPMRIYAVECHSEAQAKLETLQTDLNNQASTFPSVTNPELGLFVTAYRNILSSWCRAEIVQTLSDTLCSIFYIDHGNHEVIALDKLKLPTPVFMTLPKQALTLSLDGITCISQSGEWDQLATDYIKTHCMNKKRSIRFGEKMQDGYLVTLYEDDTCQSTISQKLIELGLCASTDNTYPQQVPLSAPAVERSPLPATEERPSTAQPKKKWLPDNPIYPPGQGPSKPESGHNSNFNNFRENQQQTNSFQQQTVRNTFIPRQISNFNQDTQNYNGRQSYQNNNNNGKYPSRNTKYNQGQNNNRNNSQTFQQNKPNMNRSLSQSSAVNLKSSPRKPKPPIPETKTEGEVPIFFASSTFDAFCPSFEKARKDKICVEVTYVGSPSDFAVVPVREKDRHKRFIEKLENLCLKNPVSPCFTPILGQLVLYRDEERALHRAEVTSAKEDDKVTIYLIDSGEMADTNLANLQSPPYAILEYNSPLALNCSLLNIRPKAGAWSNSETDIFKTLALNKKFDMTSVDLKHVDLWDNIENVSLNVQFDAIRNRTHTTPVPFDPSIALRYAPGIFPRSGQHQILVTEYLTNKVICVQIIQDTIETLRKMESKLKSHSLAYPDQLESGAPYLAQFSEDNLWYRAKVLGIQESGVLVEFVDFGNKEEKLTNQIRALPADLVEPAPLAHHCLIYEVSELGETWSADMKQKLSQLISGKATALWRGESNRMPIIELFRDDPPNLISLTRELQLIINPVKPDAMPSFVRSSLTDIKPNSLEVGRSYPSMLLSCSSPHSIWIIRTDDIDKLLSLSNQLIQYLSQNPHITQFVPNRKEVCAFRSTSDGKAYRCIVEAISEDGTKAYIHLFDMVDVKWAELSTIQPLHPSFLALPPLAFHCKLANTAPLDADWPPSLLEEITTTLKDKQISVVAKEKVDDLFAVDISTDKCISLIEDLTYRGLVKSTTTTYLNAINLFVQPLPSRADFMQVFILEVKSPAEFYVSVVDHSVQDNQTEMMDRLNSYCNSAKPVSFKPFIDMLCACRYSDNTWYRAKINGMHDTSLTIHFIDFGNYSNVPINEIVPLIDPSFLKFPAQAIHCRLANIQPMESTSTWSAQATKKLGSLIYNKIINAKIVGTEGSVYMLELVDTTSAQNINIAHELVRAQLALSPSKQSIPPTQFITPPPQPTYTTQHSITSPSVSLLYPTPPTPSQTVYRVPQHPIPYQTPVQVPAPTPTPMLPPQPVPYQTPVQVPAPTPTSMLPPQPVPYQTPIPYQTPVQVPAPTTTPMLPPQPIPHQTPVQVPAPTAKPMLPPQPVPYQTPVQVPAPTATPMLPPQPVPYCHQPVPLPLQPYQNTPVPQHTPPIPIPPSTPHVPTYPVPPVVQVPPSTLPDCKTFQCVICMVLSPVELVIQCMVDSVVSDLQKINQVIFSQLEYSSPLSLPETGGYCLACFREDKIWYRAQIVDVIGAVIKVEFLDYGNFEDQSLVELRQMPEQLNTIPRLCCNVMFHGISVVNAGNCVDYLKESFQQTFYTLTGEIIDRESRSIELYHSDKNIIDNLILSNSFVVSTSFKQLPMKSDGYMKCIVLEIKGLDNFYLNCGENEKELTSLSQELMNFCSQKSSEKEFVPIRGACCAALYSIDDVWYRANIIGLPSQENVMVEFIDYGNKELVPRINIRPLPAQFLTLPAQAIQCTLLQIPPNPDQDKTEQFRTAVNEQLVYARALDSVPSSSNHCYVEIMNSANQNVLSSLFQSH